MTTLEGRYFIAINLSESHRKSLETIQKNLVPTVQGFRWVASDLLHITLVFCDNQIQDTMNQVASFMASELAKFPSFDIRLSGAGAFPDTITPRILWIGISEGSASVHRLHQIARTAAIQTGISMSRELASFHPHVTIARARKEHRSFSVDIHKAEVRCLEECTKFKPKQICSGECVHTKYSRAATNKMKHDYTNALHYHYVCVLDALPKGKRRRVVAAQDSVALKTHYPYYSGLEALKQ